MNCHSREIVSRETIQEDEYVIPCTNCLFSFAEMKSEIYRKVLFDLPILCIRCDPHAEEVFNITLSSITNLNNNGVNGEGAER